MGERKEKGEIKEKKERRDKREKNDQKETFRNYDREDRDKRNRDKKRKYDSDGSESDSDSDRQRRKEEKRRLKILEKKRQKKLQKLQERSKLEMLGYTNDDNPFGDSNLASAFVWKKKEKSTRESAVPKDDVVSEVQRLKRLREERVKEEELWEKEKERIMREQEMQNLADWEKKEDEFYREQEKLRAEIRMKSGRGEPIDILTKYIHDEGHADLDFGEPYHIVDGISLEAVKKLRDGIQFQLEIDPDGEHSAFWAAMLTVVEFELERQEEQRERSRMQSGRARYEGGMHRSVAADVDELLRGKDAKELLAIRNEADELLRMGEETEFWSAVLHRLKLYMAKAELKNIHRQWLQRRKDMVPSETEPRTYPSGSRLPQEKESKVSEEDFSKEEAAVVHIIRYSRSAPGQLSPRRVSVGTSEGVVSMERELRAQEKERREALQKEARKLKSIGSIGEARRSYQREEELYQIEAQKLMEEGEENFSEEVRLDTKSYWWHDKYRPRKPRYFNRVHTGYDWNMYNKTHYDTDNPPPKTVQGYKFNVFYPDLLDPTKAPTYKLESSGDEDTCIIRFHAGPPYEDVAFKIVSREWDLSHRHGFRCVFEKGVLQLYFNFKRHRYRR